MSSKRKVNVQLWLSIFMFIVPIVLGIIYYSQLPDEMAIHFNTQNVADGFASKQVALFAVPMFLLFMHGITIFFVQNDPRKNVHSKVIKGLMYWLVPVLAILIQISFIAYGLGKKIDITTCSLVGTGVLILILGNYLPKSRQNYSIGIKLPWTLASEENWNKTHQMAGKLWVLSGILIIFLAFLGKVEPLIIIVLAMTIIPSIYSFVLYKKSSTNNK